MAETKQKWLQTDKLGRKIYKVWRKRAMLAMFCFCVGGERDEVQIQLILFIVM